MQAPSAGANHSEVTEFILVGFPGSLGLHACLLALFLLAYLLTVTENLLIIAVVRTSPTLQKPMYLFLSNLSFLELSCSDTATVEVLDFVAALAVLATSLLATVISYTHIVATVLRVPGGAGRQKAFSTCASHLVVVALFYTTTIFMYARPHAISSFDLNKLVSVVYSVVTPLLNPIIYCLRNHDIHEALAKLHPAPGPS
ncbi:hypothetical protein JEQ12_011801 [Ovis aries]|uniref:G-protein coupled receptors family 1 profile domain-containing protein n=1 Tax=Ovis aries TaxID=9940 RepID=A0A836CRH2_SHEEP|nr:hypothetical protein JEQ12_011801 [Ovis aries]